MLYICSKSSKINIKIAKFPPIVVRFWSMFWGSLEASMILTFNHNMKHLSDFQKDFSETKYLKQSKSNLIFTKMQKRWFDARGALSGSFDYERGLVLAGLHWNWIEYAYTRNLAKRLHLRVSKIAWKDNII